MVLQAKFSGSTRKKIENEISFNYPNTKFLYLPVKSVKLMKESLELLFCSSVACEIEKISGYEPGDVLFLGIGKKNEVVSKNFTVIIIYETNICFAPLTFAL